MLNALLDGKVICSFDVKNKYGNHITKKYEEYKRASEKGQLTCEECGTEVIFKAGDIKIPHFAHKSHNSNCYFRDIKESEEHRKGKSIIYYWLKSLDIGRVFVDNRYGNRSANVSLESYNKVFAFEFMRNETNVTKWDNKKNDYEKMNIDDYYFFSAKDYRKKYDETKEQFRKIVQRYSPDGIVKMLDTESQKIIVLKYMDVYDSNNEMISSKISSKEYDMLNVQIGLNGLEYKGFEELYNYAFNRYEYGVFKKHNEEMELKKQAEEYKKIVELSRQKEKNLKRNSRNEINDVELRKRYGSEEGYEFENLDDETKKMILDNPSGPWLAGRFTRLIQCEKCKRYYLTDYSGSYSGVFGTCYNCDNEKRG